MAGEHNRVNFIRFRPLYGDIICCSNDGVHIYDIELANERAHHLPDQAVMIADILKESNLMAFIPKKPVRPSTVVLYDRFQESICATLQFSIEVLNVRFGFNVMLVVHESSIVVHSLPQLARRTVETVPNPGGLIEVTSSPFCERNLMIYPGRTKGSLMLCDLDKIFTQDPVKIMNFAHEKSVSCCTLNRPATKLASACKRGNEIVVFDIVDMYQCNKLQCHNEAIVQSMDFSADDRFLCCSRSNGTINVYALFAHDDAKSSKFMQSKPMFTCRNFSEPSGHMICTLTTSPQPGTAGRVSCVSYNGKFYDFKFMFSGKTSEMTQESEIDLLPQSVLEQASSVDENCEDEELRSSCPELII